MLSLQAAARQVQGCEAPCRSGCHKGGAHAEGQSGAGGAEALQLAQAAGSLAQVSLMQRGQALVGRARQQAGTIGPLPPAAVAAAAAVLAAAATPVAAAAGSCAGHAAAGADV